jgi:hypothetical protein
MAACSDCVAVLVPEIQENQLVLPESTEGLTLGHYVPVLQRYRDVNASLVFDYRDKKGNAAARSHVAKLRRVKAPITEIHKRLKAEYLAITQKMDADKRDALAVVEEMIEHHDKELRVVAAEEAAEAERKKIEAEIAEVWDLAHTMNDIFNEQRDFAKLVKEQEIVAAEQARIAAEQAAEQRRLQIESEKKEAADKAAEEARLAEKARAAKAIEEANERERIAVWEAERKVKEAEERAEREKAEAEAEKKAEVERKRQEEERAKADIENIKRIHWAIIPVLVEHGMTEDQAKELILAIRERKVPALSIDYRWQA